MTNDNMSITQVTVHYSDGQEKSYQTIKEAEADILDIYAGSDGLTTVDSAERGDVEFGCEWSVTLEPL